MTQSNRTAWLLARKQGIGGSDVAAILGVSPWKTILDIYNDKISSATEPDDTLSSDIDVRHIGSMLEEPIATMFAKQRNVTFLSNEEIKHHLQDTCLFEDVGETLIIKNKANPYLMATIDRAYMSNTVANPRSANAESGSASGTSGIESGSDGELCILECKNAGGFSKAWGEQDTSDIPAYYKTQVAHYRMVTGVKTVSLAVLMQGNKFCTYEYTKLDYLEKRIAAAVAEFWNENILKRVPPTTMKAFSAVADAKDVAVISGEENMRFLKLLHDKKQAQKMLEKAISDMENELKFMLGDATLAVDEQDNKILSYASITQNRFDVKSLRAINEELYESCKKPYTYRVLKFYKFKEKEKENENE